ncbi:MAG: hypothetical protein ACPG4K_05280 [Haloferula sp.]
MTEDPALDVEAASPDGNRHLVLKLAFTLVSILGLWAMVAGWLLIRKSEPTPRPSRIETWQQPPTGTDALTQAMDAWRAFLEAPDLERKIGHVRDPERVGPMMRDYYDLRSKPYPTMGLSSPGKELVQGSQPMVVFQIEGYDGLTYPVAMAWTGQRFAVDWESLTAYGTMDWNLLLETKPSYPHVMRVYLGGLAPELKPPEALVGPRQFVRMEHRDSPDGAILALKPEIAHEVLRMVEGKRVPATIELIWNPSIQCFELQRLLGKGWSLQP